MAVGGLVHRTGQPLFVNPALAALLGFRTQGETLAAPDPLNVLMRGEAGPRQLPRRGGMPTWVYVSAAPIPWVGGPATLTTVVDISDQKRIEHQLETGAHRWEQAEEVAQLGVWEYSVATRRSHWTVGMYGIFGIASSEAAPAGLDFFPYVHPEDRPRVLTVFNDSFQRGQEFSVEMRIRRADDAIRHCRCRWSVERRANGKPIRMFGVLADITDMKCTEQAARERERLLTTVLAAVPYMLSAKDAQGRIILANPQLADGLQIPLSDLVNARLGALPQLNEAFREKIGQEDRQVLDTGQPLIMEAVQGRLPGAMERWHRVIKLPLQDDVGHTVGVVGLAEDITGRLEAERRRGESQRLLQDVLDSIPYSVFVKDVDGRYILANAVGCKAVGLPHAEVMGKRSEDLPGVAREVAEAMNRIDASVLARGQAAVLDGVPSLLQQYASRSFRVIKAPLHNVEGKIAGVIGVAEDVTERVEAQRRLRESEHLLQTIVDTLPENVALKDREGRYILVNEQFARTHGVAKADAIGKRASDFDFWPEHTKRWIAMDRQILEQGLPATDIDHELVHADGTASMRVLHKVPFRNDRGEIVGILAVSRDITARKRAEQDLVRSERLLQTVIDALPQAVFLKDLRGKYLMVNAAYAAAHGITKDGALQSSLEDLPGGGPEKPFWTDADRQVLETGQPVHLEEVPFTAPGGKIRIRTLYKFPFWNPQGELVGILGVSEDITDRKREALALFQAQKMESLGLLAGGVAHDFNNLLMAISGNAFLAMADLPSESRAAESLRNILNATEMGAGLTRQMLAIAGKVRIQPEAVDVSRLAGNIAQLLRAVVSKSVELRQELTGDLRTVTADPSQIQQVTLNLVRNAADAIAAEGVIVIRTGQLFATRSYLAECQFGGQQEEGVFVYIEVSDTGFGMAPETIQRIFDPFYTTKVTGRGLGLAAVLAIVQSHKGVLRVISELGQGTTFRILLPADAPAVAEAEPAYQR